MTFDAFGKRLFHLFEINIREETCLSLQSDLTEQRMWWQLEEMTKNLVDQAQRLSSAVEDAKAICANRRVTLMQRLASELLGKECVRQVSFSQLSLFLPAGK